METENSMDSFLRRQMSVAESGITEPSLGVLRNARDKVTARKKQDSAGNDVFYLVARFINLHVKLSYAVVLVLGLGLSSLYFAKENTDNGESISSPYVVNIASARSSTVLSSIVTFESRH